MASEYDCGNEEDSTRNSVYLMNVIGEYPAMYDIKTKDFKTKVKTETNA